MYQKPSAPLSILGVVGDVVRLYRASFNRAWVPALIMELLVMGALIYVRATVPGLLDAKAPTFDFSTVPSSLVALYFLVVSITLIFSNAMIAQQLAVRDGSDLTIAQSLATGLRFFPPVVAMAILLGGIGGIASVVLGAAISLVPPSAGYWVMGLFVLLLVYLAGRVMFANVALLGERSGVWSAIRISWQVTRGQIWRAAAVLFLVLLIWIVALLALQFAASLLSLVARPDTFAGMLALQLVSAVIQAAAVPLFYAGFVSTYHDLKIRVPGDPVRSAASR